ncbi:MAG: hypothetical protein HQL03_06195 [Nitrospirae bacterium]|nr:hypothetical protein [Nitrospirota bacterium]MBF0591801.1 hypothetical protein [Nitrospirota bacterium]
MQRRRVFTLCLVLVVAVVYSCGGGSGPGSPGSTNPDKIGGYITITAMGHSSPKGDQGDQWQMDMVRDMCGATGGSTGTPEQWGDDTAVATVALTSYNTTIPANTIFIQRYTVEFTQQVYELNLPPITMLDLTTSVTIKPDSSGTVLLVIMPSGAKITYWKGITSGLYNPVNLPPYLYDMKITLYGVDTLGNSFSVPVHRTISVADYNNC